MTRQKLSIGLVAAAFTLSLAPVWAQERERPSQGEPSRPSNGDNTGTAVPRGSTDSGSSPAPSSSGSATSSGGSSSSPSDSSTAWTGSSPIRERAPVRPDGMDRAERAEQRRGNGSGTTGRAVPRGESGGNSGSTDSTSARSGSDSQPSQGRSRAVPTYSRPRDGRNPVGSAVERTNPRPGSGSGGYGYVYDPFNSYYYNPYYSGGRYSYWSPFGYGYGLGYFSYDPFLFSGYGYPGSGYGGSYYDPYYGGSGGYSSRAGQAYREVGSLRLKVKPSNAQVYIDGYFVGVIDSYDGAFQRLSVEAGPHRVELKAEGFEPVQFEVMITPGETITYKGEMKLR
jgi:PEGA domain-containing protein